MSKIQETAPDTIYLNIGGDTDDDLDFDLDAEVTWCHEPVFDNDIKYIKQPKLSIPKKIAEELDGFNPNDGETKIEVLIEGYYKLFLSDELMSFCLTNKGLNLCAFYLAGKALGVELVEVSDE